MLPFGGQGSNSAIEDGGSLGYLFRHIEDPTRIPSRLQLFQLARQSRAARIQTLSSVRAGREKDVEAELRQYSDPPGSSELAPKPCRIRSASYPSELIII